MSFCRITGKSRGLPKPNYFPLLPPISPADAKRFCRITNKSQGLPGHHFIPALLAARGPRTHCRVTAKSEGQAPHHFPTVNTTLRPHDIIPGFKYVFPKFDEDKKLQQRILNLISTKTLLGESNARYVYPVEERSTGLVIPAGLEAAVRDGEIRDVMLDKEKDTMLVKLHQGPSVAIDVTDLIMEDGMVLWDGLGPSQSVLKQWEKEEREAEARKKKRREGLHSRKQIFEDKERAAEEEESELERIKQSRKSKIVKVKMRDGDVDVMVDSGPTPFQELQVEDNEPVFGHIVQTGTAVEFFPGDSILNLPEGKVVSGRLFRNADGLKFVPGIMSEGRFVPGQVVKTNTGEQFVPGQVVDTRDGPKFVPGQVAETLSGPKFVPGQTIETEFGPQFVPGQIIETKAGPTFIPGQIIVTDDEPRFVPGRVVETAEGPRFVPGRVIESGNHVTFVAGQVVETSEGLKFVAPDLEYMPEGGHEFSVQGFEVSPEELKLLRPAGRCDPASSAVFTVDSKMLRQLSEAGVSVGRQVPAKIPEVDISPLPVVVEKLKLDGAQALKMSHVMTVLSQVALKISQRSDLCASDIPLDEDAGEKILLAIKKNKDLGKQLQAIVASSVVAARSTFDQECLLNSVTSALQGTLSEYYETTISKEGILSIIDSLITTHLPRETSLLSEIATSIEDDLKAQSVMSEESLLTAFHSVLESALGKDNSTTTKAALLEAVKSEIKREQSVLYENINKECFLSVLNSAMNSGLLEKASDLLSREAIVAAIHDDLDTLGSEWTFNEETAFSIIKSAIEKEVSAKGVTLNNGSLPAAIMMSIRQHLSQKPECLMTEEKLVTCLFTALENNLPEELSEKVSKRSLIQAIHVAIRDEKSKHKITEEKLLTSAIAVLEKTLTDKSDSIPNGKIFLEEAVAAIRKEVAHRHENADVKKVILQKMEKAIDTKLSETFNAILNEEMAMSAIQSVIADGTKLSIPKEKLKAIINSAFEKEKSISHTSIISKEKLLAVLENAIQEEESVSNATVLTAFNAAVEEKRKAKYANHLTEQSVMSAVESAIEAVVSQGQEMKASKGALISAVKEELKRVNASGGVTEGRIVASVLSAVKEELEFKGESTSVEGALLEAIESELEKNDTRKCRSLLTEEEVLSTLDSAIELELTRNPCSVTKAALMEQVKLNIIERKETIREGLLTENVLLECMQSAIRKEVAESGEKHSVIESLLACINSAIEEEREAKRFATLKHDSVIRAVCSAMDSELMQNNKISLTKCELVKLVDEAIRGHCAEDEKSLIRVVQATINEKVTDEGEVHLLLKAFGSAIEQERAHARKKPICEKAFMNIVGGAIENFPNNESLTKDKLLSAISDNIEETVKSHGDLLTEQAILSIAYSAIEKEVLESGENVTLKELLLTGIDAIVECRREKKRVVDDEIIMEAVNMIADEFIPEGKTSALNAITSAIKQNGSSLEAAGRAFAEFVSGKDAFISAMCTAIADEQASKRGTIVTKEMMTEAVTAAVEDQLRNNPDLLPVKDALLHSATSAVEVAASDKCLSEKALLSAISSSFELVFGELVDMTSMDTIVNSMQKYLSENLDEVIVGTVNYMTSKESAADKLKYAMNNSGKTIQVIQKLSSVLDDNMGEAFQKLSASDPSLVNNVMELLNMEEMTSAETATEALQRAIVGAVRQRSAETLRSLPGEDFHVLLMQAVGLAKALGLQEVVQLLTEVASDFQSHELLANDPTVMDILQRLTIMRRFAQTKPELNTALEQLVSDPELAKRDPGIRELVRHSTALMSVPEEVLRSSADIPISLLLSGDPLAMEEFLARARRPRTLVIVKAGMQAVVPKEASRAVLTGQVPYAVLDERGIRYFEPLHVFSTMKLPRYAAHCFSMYKCPEVDYDSIPATPTLTPRGSFSSADDLQTMNGHWPRAYRRGAQPSENSRRCSLWSVRRSVSGSRIFDLRNGNLY